jgi:hypothetical protein
MFYKQYVVTSWRVPCMLCYVMSCTYFPTPVSPSMRSLMCKSKLSSEVSMVANNLVYPIDIIEMSV